ncbi:MAG: hypothetical protein HRT38_02545 [Alteromonadaceae bacterium]|nr:hypothetical protein [Alteromonadaceae bacterium]
MNVGSITVINLTGNTMDIRVNSRLKTHTISDLNKGTIEFKNGDCSPATSEHVGYIPSMITFLRAIDADQNYFGNEINKVNILVGGKERNFEFVISGNHEQALINSATLSITRESFILAAPNGRIWYSKFEDKKSRE